MGLRPADQPSSSKPPTIGRVLWLGGDHHFAYAARAVRSAPPLCSRTDERASAGLVRSARESEIGDRGHATEAGGHVGRDGASVRGGGGDGGAGSAHVSQG